MSNQIRVKKMLLPVPESPLCLIILQLWCLNWFRKCDKWESKVGKPVLILLNVGVSLDELVQLKPNQAGNHAGGCSDGRDNTPSNALIIEII